jgi:hypothetical protein
MKMKELDRRKLGLTDTESPARPGDFPIGSPQSRAAARSKLENWSGDPAPNLSLIYYEPGERRDDGTLDAPVRTDSNHAIIFGGNKPELHVNRFADESLNAFEARATQIMSDSRGRGKPRGAIFERIENSSTAA